MHLYWSNSSVSALPFPDVPITKYKQYWDWSKYPASPHTSPLFNGDEYSMSGNGKMAANYAGAMGRIHPAGLGGGCVGTGPFKNMTMNLGRIGIEPVGPSNGPGYNPRCLKRGVGSAVATQNTNHTSVIGKLY
jgi:tyrosinase